MDPTEITVERELPPVAVYPTFGQRDSATRVAKISGTLGRMNEPIHRKAGRPKALSRRRVAEAVLAIGFAQVKVSHVAAWLGVNPATVYRFARGRSELIDLAVAELVNLTGWPTFDGRWRDYLAEVARTLWQLLGDHPGLATATGSPPTSNIEIRRLRNRIVDNLVVAGFDTLTAASAADLTLNLAMEDRLGCVDVPDDSPFGGDTTPTTKTTMARDLTDRFERKLTIVLDGIECQADPGRPR